jgi:hypothetical protein
MNRLFILICVLILSLGCGLSTTPTPSSVSSQSNGANHAASSSGTRRIVLVPVNGNGTVLVNYDRRDTDCIIPIRVRESVIAINVYPTIAASNDGSRARVGVLHFTHGVVYGTDLMWGPTQTYRWAYITIPGTNTSGWVHADPPWTASAPTCTARIYDERADTGF